MQVDAGSHAGFISHETASIRLCPAQNVAKSTGVLDLAQVCTGPLTTVVGNATERIFSI